MTIQEINLSQADREILNDLPIFVNDLTAEIKQIEAVIHFFNVGIAHYDSIGAQPEETLTEAALDAINSLKGNALDDVGEVQAGIRILHTINTDDAWEMASKLTELVNIANGII